MKDYDLEPFDLLEYGLRTFIQSRFGPDFIKQVPAEDSPDYKWFLLGYHCRIMDEKNKAIGTPVSRA